jgi:hypothetical protein
MSESLTHQLTVDHGDHDGAIPSLEGAIDHEHVARMDLRQHRFSHHSDIEGGQLVAHQVGVEVEMAFQEILSRRWEAGWHRDVEGAREGEAKVWQEGPHGVYMDPKASACKRD